MNMLVYPLAIGTWEIVLIVLAILILFGAHKIPEFMKNLGKSVKSFKQGMNEVEKDLKDGENTPSGKNDTTGDTTAKE